MMASFESVKWKSGQGGSDRSEQVCLPLSASVRSQVLAHVVENGQENGEKMVLVGPVERKEGDLYFIGGCELLGFVTDDGDDSFEKYPSRVMAVAPFTGHLIQRPMTQSTYTKSL